MTEEKRGEGWNKRERLLRTLPNDEKGVSGRSGRGAAPAKKDNSLLFFCYYF